MPQFFTLELQSYITITKADGSKKEGSYFARQVGELQAVNRENGVQIYGLYTMDINEVQPGDWFMAALDLGPVMSATFVEADYGYSRDVALKIVTRDDDSDLWAADQTVAILRPVPKPRTIVELPDPAEALAVLHNKLVKTPKDSFVVELTGAEVGVLKEVFDRHLGGEAVHGEGPLLDAMNKVRGLAAPKTVKMFNKNSSKAADERTGHAVLEYYNSQS